MIVEEEQYLQHFGKKGMKWGVRNARPKGEGRQSERSTKEKAAIAAVAGAAFIASHKIAMSLPVSALIGGAAGFTTKAVLDRRAD